MTRACSALLIVTISGACGLLLAQAQDQGNRPPVQGGVVQQSPPARRVRVLEKVSKLFVIKKVEPEYPQEARAKGLEGTVVLKVEISPEGDVTEATPVLGDPAFGPAAIHAVKQWKYNPYLLNGRPVAIETSVSLSFQLPPS